MVYVKSGVVAQMSAFLHKRSYWSVRIKGGEWLSELDEVIDIKSGSKRNLSWHDDIVVPKKHYIVTDLQLHTPRNSASYFGNVAILPITTPASSFVLNGRSMSMFTDSRYPTYQIIGRVMDSTGVCECFIYDYLIAAMGKPYHTNVRDFQPWREGASPIGPLALDVLGLEL